MPAGKITKLYEDDKGLRYRAKLNLKTDWGRNAYEALLAGDVTAASIGYNEIKGKNAINDEDGVKDLNELSLWEISAVTFPSLEAAVVDDVKSDIKPETEPEELEVKAGRTISSATRSQLVTARDVLNILIGEAPAEPAAPAKTPPKSDDVDELLIKRLEHIKEILE
jgi:uncharacterized protein